MFGSGFLFSDASKNTYLIGSEVSYTLVPLCDLQHLLAGAARHE